MIGSRPPRGSRRPLTDPSPPPSVPPGKPGSWPIGLLLLSLMALALYVPLLANATYTPAGGGEALMSQAFEMLFLVAGLWFVLVAMFLVAVLREAMPSWVPWLALFLVPMAAIANATAADMCSRHMEWAVVLVAALPALVAFYCFWGRLPRLQAKMPAERTSVAVWGAIFFLSVITFVVAAY